MEKPLVVVKNDYTKYKSLCYDKKTSYQNPIVFDKDKPSRQDTLYHLSNLRHISRIETINLIAEQKKLNNCSYKFQIRCKDFCEKPLFRFDSDGSTHQNSHMPLAKQQITTPHFNCYNENGVSFAYKRPELEIIEYEELKEMGKFFDLFCQEVELVFIDNNSPSITPGDVRILQLDIHSSDLLSDVNFEV